MKRIHEICPKCHVESYSDGKCQFCDYCNNGQVQQKFNEEAAAISSGRCPCCLSYTTNGPSCVYCGYRIHEFDYNTFPNKPILEFIRLYNEKRYKESIFSIQDNLAKKYDPHLHETLLYMLHRYYYSVAPLPD